MSALVIKKQLSGLVSSMSLFTSGETSKAIEKQIKTKDII